LISKIKFS
jgi:hypothetical protein